jgi:hypothetical protein
MMTVLWTGNDNAHRGDTVRELLELLRLFPDAGLDGIRVADILEAQLEW